MRRRAARWAGALLAVAAGVTHLALAGAPGTRFRSRPLGVRYAEGAVFGARYLVVLAGVTLVLLARPLMHGKRNAWTMTLAVAALTVPGHHVKHGDVVGFATSVMLVVSLVVARRSFRVRSDPARARQGWQLLLGGLAVVFVYGVVGLSLLDRSFTRNTPLPRAVAEVLRLLVLLPVSTVEPATRHGSWFVDSVRIAALGVVLAAVVRLVATTVLRRGHSTDDEATVRALLDTHATTALAYFHLLDDKVWFLSSDRQAFVGYKLVGRCAVVLGEPIGAAASIPRVLAEFLELCDANGWIPVFHQVTEAAVPVLRAGGLTALKIGEEAIVPVQEWSVDDKRYKSLRSALRRMERAGYRVVELPRPIDDATMAELHAVSDRWLASGGHRERTFTLGRFDPDYLRATTVIAAVDADGRIGAFANVLPGFRGDDGNFDLMRRDPGTPNGIMELLFVGLIDRFRREGRSGMNLGLAPLAGVGGDSLPDRALQLLYEHGEQAFNFRGLAAFKEKWHPRWEARYLCYRRPAELPLAAAAVSRAGELPDPRRWPARAGAILRRNPVTAAVFAVVFWFMLVTQVEPEVHGLLVRQLGLRWADLVHLQFWRLGTSQLVQTKPGLVWGNVALLLAVLPLAERRLGSRRTVAVFFLGDWLSTVPVLVGVRLFAGLGNLGAMHTLARRDGGSSSGAWALAAAVAVTLPAGRLRRAVIAFVVVFNVLAGVVQRELVDLQHGLAIVAAVGLTVLLDRRARSRTAAPAPATGTLADATAAS